MESPWTAEQQAAILDDYWRLGAADCPVDGQHLRALRSGNVDDPALVLTCGVCGGQLRTKRSTDPRAPQFRGWSDSEKAGVVAAHRRGATVICPVDGSRLATISFSPGSPDDVVRVQCDRCGGFTGYRAAGD